MNAEPHAAPRAELSAVRFRIFAAMATGASALSIDSILPALADIRRELGLAEGSSATAGLLTAFFLGSAIGQLPMGLLADRYGRRPVLSGCALVYLLGIAGMSMSPSLSLMLVSRVVWGLGAAGLQVGAMAMARDRYVGARMAREMSFVMAVFLIVPVFAPAVGAGVIALFPWRVVLAVSAVFGAVVLLLARLMPETLAPSARQPLRFGALKSATRDVLASRATVRCTLAMIAVFGAFSSYLATGERIIGDIYGRRSLFPFLFGAVGIAMAVMSVLAGRNVERIGLLKVIRGVSTLYLVGSLVVLAVVLAGHGTPNFWLYWCVLTALLSQYSVLYPNINAAAMMPVGHIAGTASAIIGTLATAGGALIGAVVDHAYDSTVRPISIAFAISAAITLLLVTTTGALHEDS